MKLFIEPYKGSNICDQLIFTVDFLLFACNYAREFLKTNSFLITDIPNDEKASLALELKALFSEYRRLWMKNARPGGFKESISHLEKLHDLLGK